MKNTKIEWAESAMAWNTRVDVGQFADIVTAVQARDMEIDKLKTELAEANEYARRLSIKVRDQGNDIARLKNMLEAESRRAKAFEEALDEIGKSVPCSQGGGGWFWPYCDGYGNEVGAIPVDPAQVFQEMAGIAHNALNMKPNA